MKVFPAWADYLELYGAVITGLDFPLHAEPAAYREAVQFIKDDPFSLGALITTHKLDLFDACHDLFDEIDPHAELMREASCLFKRGGKLICHAKDPISSGLAIDGFLRSGYFRETGAEVLSMGAGGSTIAITWHLMRLARGDDVPARIIVTDRVQSRLAEIAHVHASVPTTVPISYVLTSRPELNDNELTKLKPGSLVINATGLGKDEPGSPITDNGIFPQHGVAWELNYRGDLVFRQQAQRQQSERHLHIVDGWTYFLHGWTQVIAEVFNTPIAVSGPQFDEISAIALRAAKA